MSDFRTLSADYSVAPQISIEDIAEAKAAGKPVVYHEIKDYAHGPAWTRKIMGDQLRVIDDYLSKDCGGGGL